MRREHLDASTGYIVSVRGGGRKRFVTGMDGDFILYGDDPREAAYVDPEDLPRVVLSVIELYDPDKVVLERQRLV